MKIQQLERDRNKDLFERRPTPHLKPNPLKTPSQLGCMYTHFLMRMVNRQIVSRRVIAQRSSPSCGGDGCC
jgi:hypothetical protein